MGKKKQIYTVLSELSPVTQYANIVAVINSITPIFKASRLKQIKLEVVDRTQYNPGFTFDLRFDGELLNRLLDVANRGMVVELVEVKIVKNDGVIYGIVNDEEELRLINDNLTYLKWYPDEELDPLSDDLKHLLKNLNSWKRLNLSQINPEAINLNLESDTRTTRAKDNKCETPNSVKIGKRQIENTSICEGKSGCKGGNALDDHHSKRQTSRSSLTKHSSMAKEINITGSSISNTEKFNQVEKNKLKKSNSLSAIDRTPESKSQNIRRSNSKGSLGNSKVSKNSLTPICNSSKLKTDALDKNRKSIDAVQKSGTNKDCWYKNKLLKKRKDNENNEDAKTNVKKIKLSHFDDSKHKSKTLSRSKSFGSMDKQVNLPDEQHPKRQNSRGSLMKGSSLAKQINDTTLCESSAESSDQVQKITFKKSKSLPSINMYRKPKTGNQNKRGSVKNYDNAKKKHSDDSVETTYSDDSIVESLRGKLRDKLENTKFNDSISTIKKDFRGKKPESSKTRRETTKKPELKSTSPTAVKLHETGMNKSLSTSLMTELFKGKENKNITRKNSDAIQSDMLRKCISLPNVTSKDEKINKVDKKQFINLSLKHDTVRIIGQTRSTKSLETCRGIEKYFVKQPKLRSKNSEKSDANIASNKNNIKSNKLQNPALYSSDSSISSSNISFTPLSKNIPSSKDNNKVTISSSNVKRDGEDCSRSSMKHKNTRFSGIKRELEAKKESQLKSEEPSTKTLKHLSKNAKTSSSPKDKDPPDNDTKNERKKTHNRSSTSRAHTIQQQTTPTAKSARSKDPVLDYLEPLTRNLHLREIQSLNEISLYDLEEIEVPDKFDIVCKVISKNTVIDEGIQVIRVQDGTICKSNSLIVPECKTWTAILESIQEKPIVQGNLPFIDIIIFDYTRIEINIKPNKNYKLRNIMAIRLNIKNDPRKDVNKAELFFCVEGSSINPSRWGFQVDKDLERKIQSEKYQLAWKKIFNDVPHKKETALEREKEDKSPPRKRLKKSEDEPVLNNTPKKNEDKEKESGTAVVSEKSPETNVVKNIKSTKYLVNGTTSSDETALTETPPILRELSEILHEESLLGLPFVPSEDIHLKNSGSEITFSEFARNADLKSKNFRTSTQEVTPTKPTENCEIDNSVIMELALSASSKGSVTSQDDVEALSNIDESPEVCSQSVIQTYKGTASPKRVKHKQKQSPPASSKKQADANDLLCVDVSSSNSSDLECEEVHRQSGNHGVTKPPGCNTPSPVIELPASPDRLSSSNVNDTSNNKTPHSSGHSNVEVIEDIEVVSCSSSASILSVEGTHPYSKHKKVSGTNLQENQTINESTPTSSEIIFTEERLKSIPSRVFFKATLNPPVLSQEQVNEIYTEDDRPASYFVYSFNRQLPFVDVHTYRKLSNLGYLPITTTIISITPSFEDSWQEHCFKSRCPSCNKLYNVYNASNNRYTEHQPADSAISVGSHVVCPNSKCCNQVLDTPEFHFTVQLKVKSDHPPLTALIGPKHAEDVFGCSAKEAIKDENKLKKVAELLKKVSESITSAQPIKLNVTREKIFDPKSSPLYIQKFKF